MSYSVKKAGIAFKAKVDTAPDFTGQAAGFSVYYVRDSDDAKTEVTGAFTESTEAAGLYFTPNIVINEPGDYTVV